MNPDVLKNRPYFVLAYKFPNLSSTDLVKTYKKILPRPIHKIGHIGTLDPFAEGLMLLGVNGGQKLNEIVHQEFYKTYVAQGYWGVKTSTGDHTSPPIADNRLEEIGVQLLDNFSQKYSTQTGLKELEEIIQKEFLGEYWQAPHLYSAAKFQGKRLYKLLRNEELGVQEKEHLEESIKDNLENRKILRTIVNFKIVQWDFPNMTFEVTVSSGTYIRVLFEEIAEKFGLYGHLTALKRSAIGPLTIEEHFSHELPISHDLDGLGPHRPPIYRCFPVEDLIRLPQIRLNHHYSPMVKSGVLLRKNQLFPHDDYQDIPLIGQKFWALDSEHRLIGLFTIDEKDIIRIVFNFAQ